MTQKQGYPAKNYSVPTKRYCQTLSLKDNPALIAEYRKIHMEMEMYICGTQVFMIVETPLDFDWDTAMEELSHLPRQQEWEDYVARFQECVPGSTSSQKWKLMERMFYLYDE